MKRSLLPVLLLFLSAPMFAQNAGGVAGISGVVRDPSNATVPSAQVVISSVGQGTIRTLSTNAAGIFTAPALTPGPGYKVTVTAAGFAQYQADNLVLAVGQNLNLNVALTVGGSVTQVEVSATQEMVDDTKSDVSTLVDSRQIEELPINGRRVDSFVLLTPGVTNDATFGLLTFRGVAGNNSFLIDGNDNTEQFYDENAGRTRIQSQISQDAVQEFQVVSSDYSAEYGRAMGGVVNTVTKSGTNDVHGSGFYYFRSTGFDAHDPFASFNPSEKRVEGGATVGGPDQEEQAVLLPGFRPDAPAVPHGGQLRFGGRGRIRRRSNGWAARLRRRRRSAAPSTRCCRASSGRFRARTTTTWRSARLDYHLSDKNTFTAEFNFLRWLSPNGIQTGLSSTSGAGITGNGDDSVRVRNGKVRLDFRAHQQLREQLPLRHRYRPSGGLLRPGGTRRRARIPGRFGGRRAAWTGHISAARGAERNPLRIFRRRHLVQGKHTLKFGFNFFTTEDYNYYISNAFGSYTYLNPTQFAQDYSSRHGREELVRLLADFRQPGGRLPDQRAGLVCAGPVAAHVETDIEPGGALG